MAHAKYWEQYISQYIGKKIDIREFFSLTIIIVSISGGIAGFWAWQAPVAGCCIIAILQLIVNVRDSIIIDNEAVSKYSDLRDYYIEYFNKLEKLWLEYDTELISEQTARDQYLVLRESTYKIERLKDALHISKLKRPGKLAELQLKKYINYRYSDNQNG
jgi:hypothetical protein